MFYQKKGLLQRWWLFQLLSLAYATMLVEIKKTKIKLKTRFIYKLLSPSECFLIIFDNSMTTYTIHEILFLVETRRNTQVWLKGSVLKPERGVKARGGSNPSSSSIIL